MGTGSARPTRIVSNHRGTPAASIQQAGTAVEWYGGFEPFGEDWQAGTGQDSLAKGIFLRMPGQWKDPLWSDATYPMELFYNVRRWYETGTGRYTSVDPLGIYPEIDFANLAGPRPPGLLFGYGGQKPLRLVDPLGLEAVEPARPTSKCDWSRYGAKPSCCAMPTVARYLCKKVVNFACKAMPSACCESEYKACISCIEPECPDSERKIAACAVYRTFCDSGVKVTGCALSQEVDE